MHKFKLSLYPSNVHKTEPNSFLLLLNYRIVQMHFFFFKNNLHTIFFHVDVSHYPLKSSPKMEFFLFHHFYCYTQTVKKRDKL